MIDLLQKLFHNTELAIVGAIGALMSLRFHPEVQGRGQIALFIATGGAIAYFGAGFVGDYFSIASNRSGAVGFFLGIFGASLIEAMVRTLKSADLWGIISRKFGGGQ
jgi:hypothetical protein